MISVLFYILCSSIIIFLVRAIINLQNVIRRDSTMFKMAELRRDVNLYLRSKNGVISKVDAKDALQLVKLCSWTISHHDDFYGKLFDSEDLKLALKSSRKEIENIDLSKIKNKSIKALYVKFGLILLSNITKHIKFFNLKIVFVIFKLLSMIIIISQKEVLESYFKWYESSKKEFKNYSSKYSVNIS